MVYLHEQHQLIVSYLKWLSSWVLMVLIGIYSTAVFIYWMKNQLTDWLLAYWIQVVKAAIVDLGSCLSFEKGQMLMGAIVYGSLKLTWPWIIAVIIASSSLSVIIMIMNRNCPGLTTTMELYAFYCHCLVLMTILAYFSLGFFSHYPHQEI